MFGIDDAAIAAVAGSLLTGTLNAQSQSRLNDRRESVSWDMYQQERADQATAHQREVADLKAAGLNPILSTHSSGAGTASGTVPDAMAPQIEMPDIFSKYVSLKQMDQADKRLQQGDRDLQIKAAKAAADIDYSKA